MRARVLISWVNDNHADNYLKEILVYVYYGSIVNGRPKKEKKKNETSAKALADCLSIKVMPKTQMSKKHNSLKRRFEIKYIPSLSL